MQRWKSKDINYQDWIEQGNQEEGYVYTHEHRRKLKSLQSLLKYHRPVLTNYGCMFSTGI